MKDELFQDLLASAKEMVEIERELFQRAVLESVDEELDKILGNDECLPVERAGKICGTLYEGTRKLFPLWYTEGNPPKVSMMVDFNKQDVTWYFNWDDDDN